MKTNDFRLFPKELWAVGVLAEENKISMEVASWCPLTLYCKLQFKVDFKCVSPQ